MRAWRACSGARPRASSCRWRRRRAACGRSPAATSGLKPIPLSQVVGTDSRESDFDRAFHPRRSDIRHRWQQLERAYPDAAFPPIVAYQLGDAYFVIDGHHRVAIARQNGMETIDAEVTELTARWHLPADADIVELIHAEQERIFMDDSGLGEIHPELRIRFSRPVGYIELLETVQLHGYHLMREAGRVPAPVRDRPLWFETVYEPTIEVIHEEGLDEVCPGATDTGPLSVGLAPPARAHARARMPAARRDRAPGDGRDRPRAAARGRAFCLSGGLGALQPSQRPEA